jgi:lipopolysaccharide export system protein LptC
MSLTVRQKALALALVMVGGAAWWQQSSQVSEPPVPIVRERLPDYRVEGLAATTMGTAGYPVRRMSAERMRHYADDDSSEFDRPILVAYRPQEPPWTIRAETAWASGDGQEVWLHGEVDVDREGAGAIRSVHLTTSELLIRPHEEYAKTDMPVAIVSVDDWLNATGMEVWYGETVMRARLVGRPRARLGVQ